MAENVKLPAGFVLDNHKSGQSSTLPEGFVIDFQETAAQPANQQPSKEAPEWAGKYPNLYGVLGASRETLGPVIEALGLAGGASAGSTAGPVGGVVGAGGGYAAAHQLLSAVDTALGNEKGKTLGEAAKQAAIDVPTGAAMEAGGQVLGKGIAKGAELIGKGVKQTLGATTGMGPGAVNEALKGSEGFKGAMRGKITGDEVVDNVQGALQSLKDQRASAYQEKLSKMTSDAEIDIAPVRSKLSDLLKKYNITENPIPEQMNGAPQYDFSRVAMGKSGRKDIEEIVNTIGQWGARKGDTTAKGLDVLKRQLDDFYSDSSQARQFVASIRGSVKDTLSKNVKGYEEMTKGYQEATRLIKDMESGLMLRKQGMTGRITEDQTLRRLTSSMREGNELRKDLVDVLGQKAEQDLSGQIAGYAASQIIPRGLVGKLTAGSVGILGYVNPKIWPVLAASSPRAVGEFLTAYGKALQASKGVSGAIGRTAALAAIKSGKTPSIEDLNDATHLIGTAEAATLSDYAKGADTSRQVALREAAQDQPVSRRPAAQAQPASPTGQNNEANRQAALARIAAQQGQSTRPRIDVQEVTVSTPDGEEIKYRDKSGKYYDFDPNAQTLPDDAMRTVVSQHGGSFTGVVTFDNGQAWQFKNGEAVQRVK